jgi:hypothetical protein
MLLDKATGANGITQEKYVTISVSKKDIEEARAYLPESVRISFPICGARFQVRCAERRQRLRILHDFYRPGDETAISR